MKNTYIITTLLTIITVLGLFIYQEIKGMKCLIASDYHFNTTELSYADDNCEQVGDVIACIQPTFNDYN